MLVQCASLLLLLLPILIVRSGGVAIKLQSLFQLLEFQIHGVAISEPDQQPEDEGRHS